MFAGGIDRTIREASSFTCGLCGHTPTHPIPAFASPREVETAPLCYPSVKVNGEAAEALQAKIYARRLKEQACMLQKHQQQQSVEVSGGEGLDKCEEEGEEGGEGKAVVQSSPDPSPSPPPSPQWRLVTRKHGTTLSQPVPHPTPPATTPSTRVESVQNSYTLLNQAEGVLSRVVCSSCRGRKSEDHFSRSQLTKGPQRKCIVCVQAASPATSTGPTELSKSAAKRLRKKAAAMLAHTTATTVAPPPAAAPPAPELPVEESHKESEVEASASELSCTDDLCRPNGCDGENISSWRALWQTADHQAVTERNMGRLRWLPRDIATSITSFLTAMEVLTLGATCRGAASLSDDWLIWRLLFTRRYPRSALCPSGPNSSWRRAYMLETNGLAQDLVCFHSLATKADGILGIPLIYTINPKTGCLDYATSTFDVLSLQSFAEDGVRRTVWGERFTSFLPLFIDDEHFDKAQGQLLKTSRKIVGESLANAPVPQRRYGKGSGDGRHSRHNGKGSLLPLPKAFIPKTDPEMALTLLMKMMNTQVVLLCDKGIAASESSLNGYCQLHRLLLALVERHHSLRVLIRNRLEEFMRMPEARVKEHTPSLGDLLTMLSVSDTVGWQHIGLLYLKESFDRSVLWACSRDPSLAQVTPGDESRLEKYLETQKVSMRLTLFHSAFLSILVRGGGSRRHLDDCADRYDTFQGRPPKYIRRQFQHAVQRILNLNSWPEFFALAGVPLPSKAQLLHTLEAAVGNSLKKGYHSHNTVFQNVMKSGVSKILLKGETYSAAPNIKRIQMLERWRFDGEVVFLDASCLIFDFSRELVGLVDYRNQVWHGTGNRPCIEHSGDVVTDTSGTHTISIDVTKIPSSVAALFFTVSAWTTTLKDIAQPTAHLHDVESDTEMCRYMLEDQDTGNKTAVIMCKLHRPSPSERWALTSIGHVGYGRADSYSSIESDIVQKLL